MALRPSLFDKRSRWLQKDLFANSIVARLAPQRIVFMQVRCALQPELHAGSIFSFVLALIVAVHGVQALADACRYLRLKRLLFELFQGNNR